MLFIRILNYVRGYLIINIDGVFAERFINICVHRGILIWDVSAKSGAYTAKMQTKSFFKIRGIAYVTRSRVRIAKRCGLMFTLLRYRSRWPIIIGVLLFIAIIDFTTTHIMSVDITGNDRIPTEQLRQELSEIGVAFGKRIKYLDADRIRNEMIVMDDDIAWLGINVRGSRVYIEITERIDFESIPHITGEACNLVAARDGVISRMEVKQGQTMVKKGDGVREGDVLVSGIMDSVYGGFRTVHAYGEVYAATEYVAEREYSLNYEEREYSGNERIRYGIDLFGHSFNLYPASTAPGDGYEERCEEYIYKNNILGNDVEIGGIKKRYLEYTTVKKQRTVEETVEAGIKELTEEVEQMVPEDAEIISKKNEHNIVSGDTVVVTVSYECSENIAKMSIIDESLIDKSENLDYDIESGD